MGLLAPQRRLCCPQAASAVRLSWQSEQSSSEYMHLWLSVGYEGQ